MPETTVFSFNFGRAKCCATSWI